MNASADIVNPLPPIARPLPQTVRRRMSSPKAKIWWGAGLCGIAFLLILFATLVGLWARSHSPHMGFGQMLTRLDSYILNEPVYEIIMALVIVVGLTGSVAFFVGLAFLGMGIWQSQRR